MKIIRKKIAELVLDPENARKHSARNLDAISNSLKRFGQRKPIVVGAGNVVLAGNGTLEAAMSLGWESIDVVEAPADWDINTARAFALADNRSAELAEWDESVLAKQLLALDEADFDIEELGFDMPQIIDPVDINEEEPPALPEEPQTKRGDLYRLGSHLLLCGDATQVDDYKALLGDEEVDMIWTDPPYGVSYVGKTKDALTIENDSLTWQELQDFLAEAFSTMITFTKPGACWYVAAPSGNIFQAFSIPLSELQVWRHTLVWVKDIFVMGRADYHYRHESIFYGWTPGAAHQEPPDRKQDTVWEIPRPRASKEHPTMKPIELITRAINNSSLMKDIVLDPFAGSGSTLIACEQTNRQARLIELDPKYCDVIIARYERIFGVKAELVNRK